ncbi:MAG: glycerol-3-phosphate 1-O-acyltransferase PlsY [Chloroflexota bacterium]|nr:glycerol-3-phosphate 1-O-acyltransferase PlsY [Chloroflexota bacterium]
MSHTVLGTVLTLAAYASGAVPWGFVFGRMFKNVDIRRYGSGSTGATNALRVLGWQFSVAVFILDFAKGFIPVLLARQLGLHDWWIVAIAVAAVAGHCWSPFLAFRGGKGMATGAGAAAAIIPWVLLVFPLMVLIVLITRYVSLASIVGSSAVSVVVLFLAVIAIVPWNESLAIVAITGIIIVQHHTNIRRLLAGNERRFGEPAGG